MNTEELRKKDQQRILEHISDTKGFIQFNQCFHIVKTSETIEDYFNVSLELYSKFRELELLFNIYQEDYGHDIFYKKYSKDNKEKLQDLKQGHIKFFKDLIK